MMSVNETTNTVTNTVSNQDQLKFDAGELTEQPAALSDAVRLEDINKCGEELSAESLSRILTNALTRLDPTEVLLDRRTSVETSHVFSHMACPTRVLCLT